MLYCNWSCSKGSDPVVGVLCCDWSRRIGRGQGWVWLVKIGGAAKVWSLAVRSEVRW